MVTIRKPKNSLIFSQPASWWGSTWREALPTGNGITGAAVYGGASNDVIMINHSDLWWQGHVGVLQDVADKVKDVRNKMEDGQLKEAEEILSNALISKGYRPQLSYPLPLCDFKVQMNLDRPAKEYGRILNMENGEITVTFSSGNTRYDRSMFVSRAQNVIAYEITKSGSRTIDVNFSLNIHDKFNVRTPSAVSKLPDGIVTKYEKFFMYFSSRSDNGTEFGVVAFINHYGGEQIVDNNGITIKGADKVLVTLKTYVESQREKEWKALKTVLSGIKITYEKLLKEHSPLHNKLFSSAEIDFDAADRDQCSDEMLRKVFSAGETPLAMYEKIWAYGRYLLICGSSPETVPCAPYGLWCGDFKAPNSQITASGSLQTIYSPALTGNLADYLLSVFGYYENVIDDLRKNASRLYASRGIFIPTIMAHGTGVLGSVDSRVIHFTGVAGWIAQLFYDYYLFTDDVKFLKTRALPFMKEVAMFYENFFKVDNDNVYESFPSYSPDTTPGNYTGSSGTDTLFVARNSLIDFAIAKELINNLIAGSEIAGINKAEIPKWKDMLTRIPDYKLNDDGTVKEYCDSKLNDNLTSVSAAMFYPVYPGTEVKNDGAETYKSFLATAKRKLIASSGEQTSMSLARYANIFVRLGDAGTACDIITSMLRAMAMNNLIFASSDWRGMGIGSNETWATYSIEGNMGVTSAISEMLLQSDKDNIKLIPVIPEIMSKGSISGFLTRTGAEVVQMNWDKKKGTMAVKLKAKKGTKVNIILPCAIKKYKPTGKETVDSENGKILDLTLPANKVISLDIRI